MKIDEMIDKHLNEEYAAIKNTKFDKNRSNTMDNCKEGIRLSKLCLGYFESMKRNMKDIDNEDMENIKNLKMIISKELRSIGLA